MNQVRTLIIDDMPLARGRVRRLLAGRSEFEIIGEAGSGPEAVRRIRDDRPDLVFLDVQMPGMDGFQVIDAIRHDHLPAVIFVTAHDEHAIRAFEVHALDYLLKPLDRERFDKALTRARSWLLGQPSAELAHRMRHLLESLEPTPPIARRLAIRTGGRRLFIDTSDLDWIEAAGNYLCLHLGKQTHLVRETMSQLEKRLDPGEFVRIHRSAIVRIDRVKELRPLHNGDQAVTLHDGRELTLSRTYRETALPRLGHDS
ncbi:MAG: LytTR family DNA-binding domain-containing protein [Gammaproteobacteria bacterium]|jgi:two-component system LytT family response regulator